MNNINVIPLKFEHIDSVIQIDKFSFSTPWSRESLEKEIGENKFARYIAAVVDEKVIGYAGMWIVVDEGHVTNIAVHPNYRGIGAGNMLMEGLIGICRMENIEAITLEVRASNVVARNLYTKYGFKVEGIRRKYYSDNKEDAIIMWNRNFYF